MADQPQDSADSLPTTDSSEGLAPLSRRIARRTTDLIGIAILAIGLLAIGGKLGRWWNTDPQDAAVPPATLPSIQPWDTEGGVSLEWGDLNYVIHHQIVSGDAETAGDRLEQIALAKFSEITSPEFAPSDAETKLLAELKKVTATRLLKSDGKLYRIGRQLPMVILTQPAALPPDLKASETRRVVCWGRAFPQSPNQWMVFLFSVGGGDGSQVAEQLAIPLPKGCRRVQRVADGSGQSWMGFRGAGSIEEGRRHFDHWFQNHDWQLLGSWTKAGSAWTVRFQSPDTFQRADIWLNSTGEEFWDGMVFLSPILMDRTKD